MPIVLHALGPRLERERLAAGQLAHAGDELAGLDAAVREARRHANCHALVQRERLLRHASEPGRDERVVADLGVGVEREVVGGERHVVLEEQLQPALGGRRQGQRRARPEDAVMHQNKVRFERGGAPEQLRARRHAGDDGLHAIGSGNLQTVGSVVAERGRGQELVEVGEQVGKHVAERYSSSPAQVLGSTSRRR